MQISKDEMIRYQRHLLLHEFTIEDQLKLKNASVLVIGAGGLGCPASLYLAAAGIGKMGIIDFDQVELSNLQRQILYRPSDLNQSKAQISKQRLNEMNPFSSIMSYPYELTSTIALELFQEYDWIVDGTDNFPTRYLINDVCIQLKKAYVYGSVFQFEGQVSIFGMENGPCYRCLYPDPPHPGTIPNCAEMGVFGVLPGLIGTIQATEVIKLILNRGNPLINRLLLVDALEMRFRELRIEKKRNCIQCGSLDKNGTKPSKDRPHF